MRDYAKVSPQFWIGQTGKRLRSSGFEAQIVAMYLMTCPHANMLGLFYCPEMFIAHETGLGLEGALKGLQRCFEAGFCEYDKASEVVWVYEMATYQIAGELTGKDLRIKGVQNEYDAIPENPYLARFFAKYGEAFKMENCRGGKEEETSPLQAPCKLLPSQEQEQEHEQEQEQEKEKAKKPDAIAARLPADWKPSDDDIAFCKTTRPDLNPTEVSDSFRDYWIAQPGIKGRKTDWVATWRNWVRNQKTFYKPQQQKAPATENFGTKDYGTGGKL